ncbi:putative cyclin-dependent kinase F-2 [Lolium rigidum]|uniref:putative cyclin-dependent kinase F-2 n=1 Tax=Lolium rigidum TaxID=89674 RepID=UPI001F5D347A|nr:putative cyclin-dependent kinase F-2 [Lolium rigidum]
MGWSSAPPCSPALDDDVATATPELSKNSVARSRFHQLELLGAGTFGVVYRARDRRTGEIVAIKSLRANSSTGHYFSAFASEVSALEKCSGHPSIVQPRASGLLGGEAFLAMEFVGPTLKHVIKHDRFRRRHTELEVRLFMRQLLAGVRRMNRLGLMHRDLKPENVLVDARGSLKICDLGLSCSMADGPPYSNPVGTPGYRAPEIILGATDYDERVDSWALGVMMAELLAGKHPFHGSLDADHLSEMLDLLGTADIKEWSGYEGRRLPGGSQPESFLRIKFPPPAEGMRIRGSPALSDAGFEVLSGLLRCNPDKRLTAAQALQHRWFKEATSTITRR